MMVKPLHQTSRNLKKEQAPVMHERARESFSMPIGCKSQRSSLKFQSVSSDQEEVAGSTCLSVSLGCHAKDEDMSDSEAADICTEENNETVSPEPKTSSPKQWEGYFLKYSTYAKDEIDSENRSTSKVLNSSHIGRSSSESDLSVGQHSPKSVRFSLKKALSSTEILNSPISENAQQRRNMTRRAEFIPPPKGRFIRIVDTHSQEIKEMYTDEEKRSTPKAEFFASKELCSPKDSGSSTKRVSSKSQSPKRNDSIISKGRSLIKRTRSLGDADVSLKKTISDRRCSTLPARISIPENIAMSFQKLMSSTQTIDALKLKEANSISSEREVSPSPDMSSPDRADSTSTARFSLKDLKSSFRKSKLSKSKETSPEKCISPDDDTSPKRSRSPSDVGIALRKLKSSLKKTMLSETKEISPKRESSLEGSSPVRSRFPSFSKKKSTKPNGTSTEKDRDDSQEQTERDILSNKTHSTPRIGLSLKKLKMTLTKTASPERTITSSDRERSPSIDISTPAKTHCPLFRKTKPSKTILPTKDGDTAPEQQNSPSPDIIPSTHSPSKVKSALKTMRSSMRKTKSLESRKTTPVTEEISSQDRTSPSRVHLHQTVEGSLKKLTSSFRKSKSLERKKHLQEDEESHFPDSSLLNGPNSPFCVRTITEDASLEQMAPSIDSAKGEHTTSSTSPHRDRSPSSDVLSSVHLLSKGGLSLKNMKSSLRRSKSLKARETSSIQEDASVENLKQTRSHSLPRGGISLKGLRSSFRKTKTKPSDGQDSSLEQQSTSSPDGSLPTTPDSLSVPSTSQSPRKGAKCIKSSFGKTTLVTKKQPSQEQDTSSSSVASSPLQSHSRLTVEATFEATVKKIKVSFRKSKETSRKKHRSRSSKREKSTTKKSPSTTGTHGPLFRKSKSDTTQSSSEQEIIPSLDAAPSGQASVKTGMSLKNMRSSFRKTKSAKCKETSSEQEKNPSTDKSLSSTEDSPNLGTIDQGELSPSKTKCPLTPVLSQRKLRSSGRKNKSPRTKEASLGKEKSSQEDSLSAQLCSQSKLEMSSEAKELSQEQQKIPSTNNLSSKQDNSKDPISAKKTKSFFRKSKSRERKERVIEEESEEGDVSSQKMKRHSPKASSPTRTNSPTKGRISLRNLRSSFQKSKPSEVKETSLGKKKCASQSTTLSTSHVGIQLKKVATSGTKSQESTGVSQEQIINPSQSPVDLTVEDLEYSSNKTLVPKINGSSIELEKMPSAYDSLPKEIPLSMLNKTESVKKLPQKTESSLDENVHDAGDSLVIRSRSYPTFGISLKNISSSLRKTKSFASEMDSTSEFVINLHDIKSSLKSSRTSGPQGVLDRGVDNCENPDEFLSSTGISQRNLLSPEIGDAVPKGKTDPSTDNSLKTVVSCSREQTPSIQYIDEISQTEKSSISKKEGRSSPPSTCCYRMARRSITKLKSSLQAYDTLCGSSERSPDEVRATPSNAETYLQPTGSFPRTMGISSRYLKATQRSWASDMRSRSTSPVTHVSSPVKGISGRGKNLPSSLQRTISEAKPEIPIEDTRIIYQKKHPYPKVNELSEINKTIPAEVKGTSQPIAAISPSALRRSSVVMGVTLIGFRSTAGEQNTSLSEEKQRVKDNTSNIAGSASSVVHKIKCATDVPQCPTPMCCTNTYSIGSSCVSCKATKTSSETLEFAESEKPVNISEVVSSEKIAVDTGIISSGISHQDATLHVKSSKTKKHSKGICMPCKTITSSSETLEYYGRGIAGKTPESREISTEEIIPDLETFTHQAIASCSKADISSHTITPNVSEDADLYSHVATQTSFESICSSTKLVPSTKSGPPSCDKKYRKKSGKDRSGKVSCCGSKKHSSALEGDVSQESHLESVNQVSPASSDCQVKSSCGCQTKRTKHRSGSSSKVRCCGSKKHSAGADVEQVIAESMEQVSSPLSDSQVKPSCGCRKKKKKHCSGSSNKVRCCGSKKHSSGAEGDADRPESHLESIEHVSAEQDLSLPSESVQSCCHCKKKRRKCSETSSETRCCGSKKHSSGIEVFSERPASHSESMGNNTSSLLSESTLNPKCHCGKCVSQVLQSNTSPGCSLATLLLLSKTQ